MEDDDMASPFWLQTSDDHRRLRRRRNFSSFFFNSGLLLTILLLIACVFVFVIIPSFLSFTSQILRPHTVKKSWDSLNLVLVLFAIICGFLSRNGVQRTNSSTGSGRTSAGSNYYEDRSYQQSAAKVSLSPRRFYDYQQNNQDRFSQFGGGDGLNRLRSFKSYPDLRQGGDDRWRFYDDTHVRDYRFPSSDDVLRPVDDALRKEEVAETKEKEIDNLDDTKDIGVDTVTAVKAPAPSPPVDLPSSLPTATPPLPPARTGKRRVQRTYRSVGHSKSGDDEWKEMDMEDFYKRQPSPSVPKPTPSPSPPPPPPPPPPEKKRSKDFLISLRRKKKKKQRQHSVENLASLFDPESEHPTQSSIPPPSPLPPPPPPPPPPHFFQNLFSPKRGKSKKIHSPPPPPRPSTEIHLSRSVQRPSGSRFESERAPASTYRPPKPVKTSSFGSVEDNAENGNASPLNPIPPPPPPPPFKMPAWRFEVRGDYVRVASFSSRSGSPDLDSEDPSDRESSPMAAGTGASASPLFCPSPDVNTKADNFIARFKAGLKLEKVNSGKAKSNLGPSVGPI
ncbi:hypothetical protein LINPERPRIM_LOCUS1277 [Linum perenne]